MPITDHEKIRVHPRPSIDCFKAIPLKKRRFFFTRSPSPPPETQSPTPADCDAPESSEHRPVSPKTEGTQSQMNAVTRDGASSTACELPSLKAEHCDTAERSSEFSETGSALLKGRSCPAVVNSASCEPLKSPKRKPESSVPVVHSPKTVGDLAEVNDVTGQKASCQPPKSSSSTSADFVASENKIDSSQDGDNSAQIKVVKGEVVFHEPCALPSGEPIPEKKTEVVGSDCHVPQTEVKNGSHGSCDWNLGPKHETLPDISNQGLGLNMLATGRGATGNVRDLVLNMNGLQPCTKKAAIQSITQDTQDTVESSLDGGSGEGRVIPSAGISLKQEDSKVQNLQSESKGKVIPSAGISLKQEESEVQNLQSESSSVKLQADSHHISLSRSNWDLNTPMDTWESSFAVPLANDQTIDHNKQASVAAQTNRLELGLKQPVHTEPTATNLIQGDCDLQKKDNHLKLPNPSTLMDDFNSETCLDLQLKPPLLSKPCNISGELGALREMSFLSLATSPVPSLYPQLTTGRTVKSEPIESPQVDGGKIQMSALKHLELKHVKTEPSEGQEASKTTISGGKNSPCARVIKPEPLGGQCQVSVQSSEGSSLQLGLSSHLITTQRSQTHQNASKDNSKAFDIASKPLALDCRVLHTEADMLYAGVSNDPSSMVDKVNPDLLLKNGAPITTVTESTNRIVTEPLGLMSYSSSTNQNDSNMLLEACETSNSTFPSLAESLNSNGEGQTSPIDAQELAVRGDLTNVQHISNVKEEVLGEPCQNDNVVQSNDVDQTVGLLSGVSEEPFGSEDGSSVAAGTINKPRKRSGTEEDYEDGEMRDRTSIGTVKGSSSKTEEQQVVDADSISGVDLRAPVPMAIDENDNKIESSQETGIPDSQESDSVLEENKVDPASLSVGELAADSVKENQTEIVCRIPKDHLKIGKGLERKLESANLSSKAILPESPCDAAAVSPQQSPEKSALSDAAGSQLQNAEESGHGGDDIQCETETIEKEGAAKALHNRGKNKRIIYQNPPLNDSAAGNSRYISFQIERERSTGRYFRRDRSNYRWNREDSNNERPRKAEDERTYGHAAEKDGPNFFCNRNRVDRKNVPYSDRNPTHENLSEHNISSGARYSRPVNAVNDRPRRITNEEMANMRRLPGRRRSPDGRLQMPMGRFRDNGRDVPDFVLLAHEDKLRNLPGDMVDHSMLSHLPPQYERHNGILVHSEQRSLSPMRRTSPIQLRSSPRMQQRSSRQWSPTRRPAEGFNGPRELVRCRSPQIMRLDRMQSPHEHPCFQEEMMARRRGSPPYIARVPNDMVEMSHSREQDFPRPARGSNRNPRRFNMIDPREIAEEEYMVRNQIREYGDGDEFVEDRCDERQGPIPPFRQHFVAGEDDGESYRFHVEDGGPRRPMRLRGDGSGNFPEGSDDRFRNRFGNSSSGRLRSIVEEQEDNYRHHGEQEWREGPFHDARPKRRRF